MSKNLENCILFDLYKNMLSEKQIFAVDMYYNNDCSLSEIAEELNISRQGVRDLIKRAEGHMNEFEEKFGLYEQLKNIRNNIAELKTVIEKMNGNEFASNKQLILNKLDEISNF